MTDTRAVETTGYEIGIEVKSLLASWAYWGEMRLANPTADHACTLRSLLDTLKELAK